MELNSTREPDSNEVRRLYNKMDGDHWSRVTQLISEYDLSHKDVIQNYLSFIQRRDLPRLLAHYEIFKKIQHLPGSIAELGVYKGNGFFTWSMLMETFCPGDRIRKVFGFDHFEGYKDFQEIDRSAKEFVTEKYDYQLASHLDYIQRLTAIHNDDNIMRGVERCKIVNGDVLATVPEFVRSSQGLRLSLLYLDVGLYEPTKAGLDHLYPLVVPGGIIAFNAYGQAPFEGESKAADELFASLDYEPKLQRFPFSTLPTTYFVKERM
ncbi:MAG: hypothetical protein IV092_11870 [Burkholderiaceae bacterium]|nr:hypothetical protein [Burkholderiaceae bacterium]